jgi:hypothetical protein
MSVLLMFMLRSHRQVLRKDRNFGPSRFVCHLTCPQLALPCTLARWLEANVDTCARKEKRGPLMLKWKRLSTRCAVKRELEYTRFEPGALIQPGRVAMWFEQHVRIN